MVNTFISTIIYDTDLYFSKNIDINEEYKQYLRKILNINILSKLDFIACFYMIHILHHEFNFCNDKDNRLEYLTSFLWYKLFQSIMPFCNIEDKFLFLKQVIDRIIPMVILCVDDLNEIFSKIQDKCNVLQSIDNKGTNHAHNLTNDQESLVSFYSFIILFLQFSFSRHIIEFVQKKKIVEQSKIDQLDTELYSSKICILDRVNIDFKTFYEQKRYLHAFNNFMNYLLQFFQSLELKGVSDSLTSCSMIPALPNKDNPLPFITPSTIPIAPCKRNAPTPFTMPPRSKMQQCNDVEKGGVFQLIGTHAYPTAMIPALPNKDNPLPFITPSTIPIAPCKRNAPTSFTMPPRSKRQQCNDVEKGGVFQLIGIHAYPTAMIPALPNKDNPLPFITPSTIPIAPCKRNAPTSFTMPPRSKRQQCNDTLTEEQKDSSVSLPSSSASIISTLLSEDTSIEHTEYDTKYITDFCNALPEICTTDDNGVIIID